MNKVIDRFFPEEMFAVLNEHARSLDYGTVVNPFDGVEYPDINTDIPADVMTYVRGRLSKIIDKAPQINAAFFRLSCEATAPPPHQAHNDSAMGSHSLMLYMQDGPGGTSLVTHIRTGLSRTPWTAAELQAWKDDTNNPAAWKVRHLVEMKANRGFIFEAKEMHRAEPIGGFGTGPEDGRIVLTVFFQ